MEFFENNKALILLICAAIALINIIINVILLITLRKNSNATISEKIDNVVKGTSKILKSAGFENIAKLLETIINFTSDVASHASGGDDEDIPQSGGGA